MASQQNMTSDALADLARRLQAVAGHPGSREELLERVGWAAALERGYHAELRSEVTAARGGGASWQEIGDVLGVTRQAAFKRFDQGEDPGAALLPATVDLLARTESVFVRLAADDYETVRSLMTFTCSRALTKRKIMAMWAAMEESAGRFVACSDSVAQTLDGRDIVERLFNRHLLDGVAVQTRLEHEAGEWMGRVAYNSSGRITGILVAAPGSENLAF